MNAYEKKGNKMCEENWKMIKKEVLRNEMSDTENEFLCRRVDELDDLVYEEKSGKSNKKNGYNFDKVDIVVVEGPSDLKPWAIRY